MISGMIDSVSFWYESLGSTERKVVKWVTYASLGATLWRLAAAYLKVANPSAGQVLMALLDLVSLPFRWALSLLGEVLGTLGFSTVESVTDRLVGDWSGGGVQQGILGEMWQLFDNALQGGPTPRDPGAP